MAFYKTATRQFLKFNTIPNKVGSDVTVRCAAHL